MDDHSNALAAQLEALTGLAMDKLKEMLSEPLDVENGPLMRTQAAAAGIALNAQLRADALRMRAARHDRALEALIAVIQSKEGSVPCAAAPAGSRLTVSADVG